MVGDFLRKFLLAQRRSPNDTTATFLLPMWENCSWWHLTKELSLIEIFPSHSIIGDIGSEYTRYPIGVYRSKPYVFLSRVPVRKLFSMQQAELSGEPPGPFEELPNTIPEAYAGPHGKEWRASVKREFDSITNLGVYVLSLLPKGMRALDCKTVFKIKYNRDYTIDKFKTRICVRGFRQKQGEEYS